MGLWNKTTTPPQNLTRAEKRNVVATNVGYVRRKSYTDVHGRTRTKDEILVPITGLANSTNWGTAKITDIWHSTTSFANTGSVTVNTWISFSEPITQSGLAGKMKITVANTVGGNTIVARTTTTTVYDGNKLLFRWKPSRVGTYKVQAQTAANSTATASNTRSTNTGTEAVSWVISGTVSNTGGTVSVTA